MDRRTFLTGVAAAAVAPALPKAAMAKKGALIHDPGTLLATGNGDWIIDHTYKTIHYTGDKPITVLDMHRKISDLWDEPENITEPCPTMRLTDDRIEMTGEYRFARDDNMLRDGTLVERHKGEVLNAGTKLRDWTEETTYYSGPVSEEGDANTLRVLYFDDEKEIYGAVHSDGRGAGS